MITYSIQKNETRYMFIRRTLCHLITTAILTCSFNLYASENTGTMYSELLSEKKKQENLTSPKTITSVNELKTWYVYKGQTLNNVLAQWANLAGWDLVWDSGQTYKLRAAASFEHLRFEQAVQELFDAVGNTDPRLYVTLYKKNKVVLVSSKPEF
ncbi:toxin co-regulated pilus biosynthesis Q family protein [Escherichia coli]|uniref:toxin co-regulated pilus biosynthesis Q family protein n=1 Tax=Escherichia coli TaxID=562 RepID=UPI002E17F16A|nr:toxin co-regulated pilus biosynthesis Q family protein [Escherichia coli]EJV3605767.1 toxin co-regulated pilus biosynthesis Q family protein [Escherichia coli]EKD3366254.1 toxin co-regulated pilus biosynthesis Q family protein [Escherichia coli]EKG8082122.1 toxin co-regulated pilus biosynthesis Q family protein [Escherichia coli]MEC6668390.1 toxin co-regulated pilus biosynthesis Q family protein [Escherichia coli]